MKYVIDSCTAFKWFVTELESTDARVLRDSYRSQFLDLIAPDVFPIEIVHALMRAERQNRITSQEGAKLVTDLFQILPTLHASLPLPRRSFGGLHLTPLRNLQTIGV
jgi:predicted nucleic acid-binding protein